jgi:hypothetical protein
VNGRALWLAVVLVAAGLPLPVDAQDASAGDAAYVLVVSGLGGTPEYADRFHAQALALVDAAAASGVPGARLRWLAEDPARAPGRIAGRSTREALAEEIAAVVQAVGPEDRLLLVLIGHGTGTGDVSKLNLPGPDLTGADLAGWLYPVAGTVAVVNTAGASGGFVEPLSTDRRVVITATRSPRESEWTWFGQAFVEGLAGGGADIDRNGRVSLLEAFTFARNEVARRYEREGQLLTEHALLDDDGDGEGSLEPSADGGADGALAARFYLGPPRGVAARDGAPADPGRADPRVRALAAERAELEDAVAGLRARRGEMDADTYEARLEALLVELARVNQTLREATSGEAREAPAGEADEAEGGP